MPHQGVANLLCGVHHRFVACAGWRFAISNNYIFDMFSFNLFACLGVAGGTSVLLQDSLALLDSYRRAVDYLSDVPTVMSEAQIPVSVQQVEVAGEALTRVTVSRVWVPIALYNDYGPSETLSISHSKLVRREDLPQRLASIGRPTVNVMCVSSSGKRFQVLQPIGVWGELWLGGVQVARGYLHRPELSAERFRRQPVAVDRDVVMRPRRCVSHG